MENIKQTIEEIPTYRFTFNKDLKSKQGLKLISLVDLPANQTEWTMLSEEEHLFKVQSEEQRLLMGVLLIPGQRIKRVSKTLGKYYSYFTAEDIREIAYKYFQLGSVNNFDTKHDFKQLSGIHMAESWFAGENDKINKDFGYNVPAGSWAYTAHVPKPEEGQPDLWETIKKEKLKGFSITAILDLIEEKENEENFNSVNHCVITYKDVVKAKIKKLLIEDSLATNPKYNNVNSEKLEQWSSECQCTNCAALKKLDWNLPEVLPEGKKEFKTITV